MTWVVFGGAGIAKYYWPLMGAGHEFMALSWPSSKGRRAGTSSKRRGASAASERDTEDNQTPALGPG